MSEEPCRATVTTSLSTIMGYVDRISSLEAQLREAQALVPAKDEALRKGVEAIEYACGYCMSHKCDPHTGEGCKAGETEQIMKAAISLPGLDARKRQEAERERQRLMRDALCEAAGFIAVQPRADEPGSYVNALRERMKSALGEGNER